MDGLNILTYNEQIHHLLLTGEVNDEMLKNFTEKINEIRASDSEVAMNNFSVLRSIGLDVTVSLPPIEITISTYGGNVHDALAIFDLIRNLKKTYQVDIYANGYCMSAGTLILLAADEKHRFAFENCTFLLHSLSAFTAGKIRQMEEDTRENKRVHDLLWRIYRENTKIPETTLKDIYEKKQDLFLTAPQAKKWGIITEVLK